MASLTIVATVKVKADSVEFVKTELLKLIDVTRAEEGCLLYQLYQDNSNPAHFTFFEQWASRELWQVHMNNQPLKDFSIAVADALDELSVSEMSQMA